MFKKEWILAKNPIITGVEEKKDSNNVPFKNLKLRKQPMYELIFNAETLEVEKTLKVDARGVKGFIKVSEYTYGNKRIGNDTYSLLQYAKFLKKNFDAKDADFDPWKESSPLQDVKVGNVLEGVYILNVPVSGLEIDGRNIENTTVTVTPKNDSDESILLAIKKRLAENNATLAVSSTPAVREAVEESIEM
jgi:hypothetical protein